LCYFFLSTVHLLFHSAKNPTCSVSPIDNGLHQVEEFKEFQIHCNVNYTGNWAPTIHCDLPFKQDNISSLSKTSKSVSLIQRIQALRSISSTTISCTTSFNKDGLHFVNTSQQNSVQEHAHNVPNQSFAWLSPSLMVLCKYIIVICTYQLFNLGPKY